MWKVLKRIEQIGACLVLSTFAFGQDAPPSFSSKDAVFVPNFNPGNNSAFPVSNYRNGTSLSVHGNNSMMLFETFMRQMNLRLPSTNYRFVSATGMNFQAGLMMNSRQPKLGASVSMPRGFSFSAGYGLGSSNLMRPGSMAIGRSPGVQFSASYRLFKGR